jgi:chlorite dismutase
MEAKSDLQPLLLKQGWHVLHLFYRVDRARWETCSLDQRARTQEAFNLLVERANSGQNTQLFLYAVIGTKADLAVWILTADLQRIVALQHEIAACFPARVLEPVYSFFSVTELSEYTTTEEEYSEQLISQDKLEPGSEIFAGKLAVWRERMAKYNKDRLYPVLPDKKVMAFYPMSKRRGEHKNWYLLPFETRKQLMGGHAKVGRKYSGRILQLITGASGLDDWEWGVTLLADSVEPIKEIVYEMRFDEVSGQYADFGPFYIGVKLKPAELLTRLWL